MFEHRLGLALSLSIGEVRALPYPEYRSWQIFYLLEPWGWQDEEYRTAALLTMMHNINVTKKRDARKLSEYIREMDKIALKQIKQRETFIDDDLSEREIERIRAQAKKDFGIL